MNAPKCPTGRNLGAHEKGLCNCNNKPQRSALRQAMGQLNRAVTMGDRRNKRAKDAKRSWKREDW